MKKSLLKSLPIIFISGLALLIVGLVNDNSALWIVGIVLLVIGMSQFRNRV